MTASSLTLVRIQSDEEYRAVGALRYKCYLADHLIDPNETGLFLDEYDRTEGAHVYGMRYQGAIASSIRLHLLTRERAVSATFSAFSDLLQPLIDSGLKLLDGARFVVDPDLGAMRLPVARQTLKIYSSVARIETADYGIAAVQPEHIKFYRRIYGFSQLSEPRGYCKLNTRLALMGVDLRRRARAQPSEAAE